MSTQVTIRIEGSPTLFEVRKALTGAKGAGAPDTAAVAMRRVRDGYAVVVSWDRWDIEADPTPA